MNPAAGVPAADDHSGARRARDIEEDPTFRSASSRADEWSGFVRTRAFYWAHSYGVRPYSNIGREPQRFNW